MFNIISITLSYLLIISILLWRFGNKGRWQIVFIVPFLIWYSIAIYFTFNTILGYPTFSTMPDGTIIVAMKIVEPDKSNKGSMNFWGMNPDKITDKTYIPRSYQMPYDEELHKQLMKKQEGSSKNGIMIWRLNKKSTGNSFLSGKSKWMVEQGRFQVINPSEILTKEDG